MLDWIKENWEKIDTAVEQLINFIKTLLSSMGEWPIEVK